MNYEEHDVVILGGGLTGMAAATQLGSRAVVLEKDDRPGGLVRSTQLGPWWFDHVLHLLYFWDGDTERLVRGLLGPDLARCVPEAYAVTSQGTVRYPFQFHLAGLPLETRIDCLRDFFAVSRSSALYPADDIASLYEQRFGAAMCKLFLFPYNRKLWKRSLCDLAPEEFHWNVPSPDVEQVLRGALDPSHVHRAYNASGYYPRPPAGASVRGMEVLSRALAQHVADLRTEHEVLAIDTTRRQVLVRSGSDEITFRYREACASSLPMPSTLARCRCLPAELKQGISRLRSTRVVMVYVAVRGRRPELGHWRYYADESLCFTRLIFMHAFDPMTAPDDGWGFMAELTERSEDPLAEPSSRFADVLRDARRAGVLSDGDEVVATTAKVHDPAYAAFTHDSADVIRAARLFLATQGVTPLGRYGRWEYTSMAQVMRDGFTWGRRVGDRIGREGATALCWPPAPTASRAHE